MLTFLTDVHFNGFTRQVHIITRLFDARFPINVLLLTSYNKLSVIIYSLFRGRQNIFLAIFSTKLVVNCATNILKIG